MKSVSKNVPMQATRYLYVPLYAVLLASGCDGSSVPEPKTQDAAGEGREETGLIRNTENFGYSGNAIGDKVDHALDANDQRTQQLDRQLGEE